MKGLIIDEPWIGFILKGEKTWEMRKTVCNFRGTFALIRKGSGSVVGAAQLLNSLPPLISPEAYSAAQPYHRIPTARQKQAFEDGWRTPWVLAAVRPLPRPVSYFHPSGAVIWVNLDPKVTAEIEKLLCSQPEGPFLQTVATAASGPASTAQVKGHPHGGGSFPASSAGLVSHGVDGGRNPRLSGALVI